jgi:glycosidase
MTPLSSKPRTHNQKPAPDCYTMQCQVSPRPGDKYYDYASFEHCQLSGLPDLNQTDPSVSKRLREWVHWVRETFRVDALRLDAAGHIALVRFFSCIFGRSWGGGRV